MAMKSYYNFWSNSLINYVSDRSSQNLYLFLSIIISVFLYLLMIYITITVFDYNTFQYHGSDENASKLKSILGHINLLLANPGNPKFITNAYLPILISFIPFNLLNI